MSEADAESTAPGQEIWIEKYRPQVLEEIHGQEETVERLQSYIDGGELPHLLFSGPAGVGKCVTGETPVLTNQGVERIGDVVGAADGFEEPAPGLRVPTFDSGGAFEYTAPSHVFGKTADEMIELETRDGAGATVTPEHQLLALTNEGFEWKRADEIEPGERLARPLSVPTAVDPELNPIEALDADRTVVTVTDEFAETHDVEKRLELADLRELGAERGELTEAVKELQYVNASGNRSEPVNPVWRMTPELARFIGLAAAEARIDDGRIKFYNTDEDLLDAFEQLTETLFGVKTVRGVQNDVPYVRVISRTLTHFLESVSDTFACASGIEPEAIGSALVTAEEDARAAFLRAMFDAEAHVAQNGVIELSQRRESHITLLAYLLSSVGVPCRRKTEKKAATNGTGTEREYHTLYISGATNLRRFHDRVSFSISEKQEALEANASKDPNPNHDTMPTQTALRELCAQLNLHIGELLTETLNPETPGRAAHCEDIDVVIDAATERVEAVQEVLEQVGRLRPVLESTTRLPAAWVSDRASLEPVETRRNLSDKTGVRSDRLLEYADGRRTPTASRVGTLLTELDSTEDIPDVSALQSTLKYCVETLGIAYNDLADGTDLRGTEIIALLENDDHDLRSLTRFETVADRVQSAATTMLSAEVFEKLSTLHRLAGAELYYDEVEAVERVEESQKVYDLTVPGTRNYVAGDLPTVMHNTTSATAIAREIYGDDWRGNFLELNASDERGIDVVRDRIKSFARSAFGGHDYRIIFLDEADSLTDDAQSALRRTMEQFSDNTRFILSCNYSSKIIDPIQSRCAVFRFSPLSDDAIAGQLEEIAEVESIELTEDGTEALVYAANGDMRRGINSLQAAATTGDVVDDEAVYAVTATARPEDIEEMVGAAVAGDFPKARATLDTLLTDVGMAGGDIIDQLHRSAWEFDLSERAVVRLLERLGEADYRIAEGASEQVQLEALLAALALDGEAAG